MRLITVEEKDIKSLMERLELEKFQGDIPVKGLTTLSSVHRKFHFVVCNWVQEHGSNYPNT